MIFITLIPTRRNDGALVTRKEMRGMFMRFETFGGATMERDLEGFWVDPKNDRIYHDTSHRVTVETDRERLEEAKGLVIEIGRQLGQEAMYFEVRYFDGVQILAVT